VNSSKRNNKILLNLHDVGYVDSSGVGELVKTYTTVRNQGGSLSCSIPVSGQRAASNDEIGSVFDIQADEASGSSIIYSPGECNNRSMIADRPPIWSDKHAHGLGAPPPSSSTGFSCPLAISDADIPS